MVSILEEEKPVCVLATPRSGSTWIYSVLAKYFEETKGTLSLGEFFSQSTNQVFLRYGEIIVQNQPAGTLAEFSLEEAQRRLSLVRDNPRKYFFKVFPGELSLAGIEWVSKNFQVVAWERRDLFQQCLSLLISLRTHKWYSPGGLQIPHGTIDFSEADFEDFVRMCWEYQMLKKVLNPHRVLFYEDFAPNYRWQNLLKALGIKNSLGVDLETFLGRQNPEDKRPLFKNSEVVVRAWKNSPLQSVQPL